MYSNDLLLWREVLKSAYRAADNGEILFYYCCRQRQKTIVSKTRLTFARPNSSREIAGNHIGNKCYANTPPTLLYRHGFLEPCIMCPGNPSAQASGFSIFCRTHLGQ